MYYAQTQNSFEEICLKYLELGDMTALRTFLAYKLNELDSEEVVFSRVCLLNFFKLFKKLFFVLKEITQTTVVISYIIEIFLNQLSDLIQEKLYDDYDSLHKEFYKFFDQSKVKVAFIFK